MFAFLGDRKASHWAPSGRRPRGPVTIGFEQLEGREMLSAGVCRSLIPADPRPLASMPRPIVAAFDPTAMTPPQARPRPDVDEEGPGPQVGSWPLGGRFRFTR